MNKGIFFLLFLSLAYISFHATRKKCLLIEEKQSIFWKIIILLGGALTVFSGIDRGESIYGFLRLFTYLTVGLAACQIKECEKHFILSTLPFLGIAFSVLSMFRGCFLFKNWILLSTGRLAGPFEYPNTMALFLLICIVIIEHFWNRGKRIMQIFLTVSLLATGSRAVFLVLCGYLLYCFIRYKGRNKGVIIVFAIIVGLSICITKIYDQELGGLSRFMKITTDTSTFQGRLLYWEDALRMMAKHPFGLGYMGYFYLQQAEQTGVYSVRFVHNEWIQWLLDYGILAGIGLIMYFIRQFKLGKFENIEKEALCVMTVCSFFDFHMQFTGIVVIALLLCSKGDVIYSGERIKKWKYISFLGVIASVGLLAADIGAHNFACQENYKQAVKWNPLSAQYKQKLLLQSKDLESAVVYADKLLKGNSYLYAAYLIKSNAAVQDGQINMFIENRKQVLRLRKYEMDEYEDYFQILLSLYLNACAENNGEVAEQCKEAMKEIPELLTAVKKQTSVRAYRIRQKPKLMFNKEYEKILNTL